MSDVNGTVTGIQGVPVNSAAPNDKDALLFDANTGEWVPGAPPQPLEPWVGSVNTQAQVIQRIPWTCRTTGSASASTGVTVTVPTDKAASFNVTCVVRFPSTVAGARTLTFLAVVANNGGTLTSPTVTTVDSASSGSLPSSGSTSCQISVSGTDATLEIAHFGSGGGVVVECQGYVDLMVI
jgi:hypothetical protein